MYDLKVKWDVWVIFILFTVALTLPYQIGFIEKPGTAWQVFNYLVDVTFLIDMVLTFFTAIQNTENNLYICDKRQIAKAYLSNWFWIDLISILPIEKMVSASSSGYTSTFQLAKVGRLSKISKFIRMIKILRMAKMFRLCKDRKRISARTEDVIRLDPNL